MNVRVAAAQDCPVLLDADATLDLVEELSDRACSQGADLVVLLEAFVPGPPVWVDGLPVSCHAQAHAWLKPDQAGVPETIGAHR